MFNNQTDSNNAKSFFNWAYKKRAATIKSLLDKEEISHEKLFLSFTSHNPAIISSGSKGLNASIKGIGWLPKAEHMPKILEIYKQHIKTYSKDDNTYGQRGLEILYKYLYSEDAEASIIDFTKIASIEMAFVHSWYNFLENPQATLLFYQPPVISYELRGKMSIKGERHKKDAIIKSEELDIYQQFVNAQHDMYHAANVDRWKTRPVYVFDIEEIYDNSANQNGFGRKLELL